MGDWRGQILREFTPQVARLTLVADPDGLLLEEGVLQAIRERGFELIPFEDHVSFRYAYESRFRSRWDEGKQTDLVVVLRSASNSLNSLPYDLLETGRKLSFNLGDLFPNLSYPVVASLNRSDLDSLYQAQNKQNPGQLGNNATKDFVLRHVFEIAPELIKQPSDLLRVLLRRHYRGQGIPRILDERFMYVLRQGGLFDDWPLEQIIPDKQAFLGFLQERWPIFLDGITGMDISKVQEEKQSYGLPPPHRPRRAARARVPRRALPRREAGGRGGTARSGGVRAHPRRGVHHGRHAGRQPRRAAPRSHGQRLLHPAPRGDQSAVGRGPHVGSEKRLPRSAGRQGQGGGPSGRDGLVVRRREVVQRQKREGRPRALLLHRRRKEARLSAGRGADFL